MTVHNVLGHETSRLDRLLTKLAFKFPKALIVHTEENRRQLVDVFGVPPERIQIVPFGALTLYNDAPMTREDARRELALEASDRAILFFGNIRDYKGLDVLLRAFKQVLEKTPRARLVVAGTCWTDEEKYRRLIDELGIGERVRLDMGFVPSSKVKVYFRAADVCALPYVHFEAQSGPGNIALGFGTPLIVTRTGGLPDLVRDERAVVPPGDAAALARALVDCLNDPERLARMSADSAALAKKYSWETIAERTVGIYDKLLSTGKGR
jgi:glycosyltransferase involved in cell wall biosynthesis